MTNQVDYLLRMIHRILQETNNTDNAQEALHHISGLAETAIKIHKHYTGPDHEARSASPEARTTER